MSSPAQHVLRPPSEVPAHAGAPGVLDCFPAGTAPREAPPHGVPPQGAAPPAQTTAGPSTPGTAPAPGLLSPSVALRVECSREGFARVRSFTRHTLRVWSLEHRCDDATLVITELAANAATHAAQGAPGAPEIRLGFRLDPAHLLVTVSDRDDRPPVYAPGTGSALEEHGRGLCLVDALSEEWGWTPTPPAGKTVWARLSTCPPI